MSRETLVILKDDLDGSEAVESLSFAFDGVAYEIDLSEKNAAAFRKAVAKYIGAARRATPKPQRASRGRVTPDRKGYLTDVRLWARAAGIEVAPRGRIPADVIAAYEAAGHGV